VLAIQAFLNSLMQPSGSAESQRSRGRRASRADLEAPTAAATSSIRPQLDMRVMQSENPYARSKRNPSGPAILPLPLAELFPLERPDLHSPMVCCWRQQPFRPPIRINPAKRRSRQLPSSEPDHTDVGDSDLPPRFAGNASKERDVRLCGNLVSVGSNSAGGMIRNDPEPTVASVPIGGISYWRPASAPADAALCSCAHGASIIT
jgi:hypothetical protein